MRKTNQTKSKRSYQKKKYNKNTKYTKNKKQLQNSAAISALKNYFDLQINSTISNTSSYYSIQNIQQGTGNNSRLGDTVSVTSYFIKLAFTIADTTQYIRTFLILDKSSDGAIPTDVEVFSNTLALPMLWNMNDRNKHRFKLLRDVTVRLDQDDPTRLITLKGSFTRPLRSTYLDNTGTATAFGQNQLYLVMVSDSGAIAHPGVQGLTRVYYFP